MDTTLAQSILKTIAFFDIFDYPLTREELFQYLWQSAETVSYANFVPQLENILETDLARKIESQGGYYFFVGKSEIIAKRERKVLYTEEKIKIAKRAARKLRYIPFVEAMFVCNLLPVVVKPTSDIDVLIIAKENRIWLTRFLSSLVLTLFQLRPTNFGLNFFSKNNKKSMTDKICLSFYMTEKHLDLLNICVEGDDVYQAYWNTNFVPLYDHANLYTEFQEQNTWVKKYLPNAVRPYALLSRWEILDNSFTLGIKRFTKWFLQSSFFENKFRILQLKHLQQKETIQSGTVQKNIVISDTMLKFHKNDRKKQFQNEWERRWIKLI